MGLKWNYMVTTIISMMKRNMSIFKLFLSKKPHYSKAKLLNLGQYFLQEELTQEPKTKEINLLQKSHTTAWKASATYTGGVNSNPYGWQNRIYLSYNFMCFLR